MLSHSNEIIIMIQYQIFNIIFNNNYCDNRENNRWK